MRTEYQLAKQVPQLTVLVLVDDEHDLARCLESIYYQDYPNLAVAVLDASSQPAQVYASVAALRQRVLELSAQ